jgi:hypothetical protein
MITKVQKVHKVLLDLLDPAFSKSIPFFWSLDEGIKLEKTMKIFLIHLHNRLKKKENAYNMEGPKGPEVRVFDKKQFTIRRSYVSTKRK